MAIGGSKEIEDSLMRKFMGSSTKAVNCARKVGCSFHCKKILDLILAVANREILADIMTPMLNSLPLPDRSQSSYFHPTLIQLMIGPLPLAG